MPSFQQHRVWRTSIIKGAIAELEGDLELPPNVVRRKRDPNWRGGFSLGIDLGMARTGLALTKGFNIRPLTVLELRGQKLELKIINIAEQQEADEFIIGLPRSSDGKETPQSNIVRSVAGRLAVRAAERGWRVYLQDEHGTTTEAVNRMITIWYWKDTYPHQVRVPNLFCPRTLNYKKNFEGVLPKMPIFSRMKININCKLA
ncbi:hypothetical protein AAHE18_12G170200 [Arachis hypogaea]